MRFLLFRCNYGHYFRNQSCPYDGWTHPDLPVAESIWEANQHMSVKDFRERRIADSLIQRMLIVESAESDCRFEGMAPESYVIENKVVTMDEVGRAFK